MKTWWGLMLTGALVAGCASRQREPDPMAFDAPPADFAIAATVYVPASDAPAGSPPPPRALRPARYVLDPDLVLHAAVGPGLDEMSYPPQTRRLRQRDADRLWRIVRDSGLLEPGSPQRVAAPEVYRPRPDRATAVLTVSYAGERRSYRVVMEESGDSGPGREVVEELAELAWMGR
jgi:hypothetical protein